MIEMTCCAVLGILCWCLLILFGYCLVKNNEKCEYVFIEDDNVILSGVPFKGEDDKHIYIQNVKRQVKLSKKIVHYYVENGQVDVVMPVWLAEYEKLI